MTEFLSRVASELVAGSPLFSSVPSARPGQFEYKSPRCQAQSQSASEFNTSVHKGIYSNLKSSTRHGGALVPSGRVGSSFPSRRKRKPFFRGARGGGGEARGECTYTTKFLQAPGRLIHPRARPELSSIFSQRDCRRRCRRRRAFTGIRATERKPALSELRIRIPPASLRRNKLGDGPSDDGCWTEPGLERDGKSRGRKEKFRRGGERKRARISTLFASVPLGLF